ncbi:MAG: 4Fe-4S binding protein [Gemmatimonadetes bacterium]|nr:4Fe-4S binding protein [Gemmatimonadota bacterium]
MVDMRENDEITALLDGLPVERWGTADLGRLGGCAPHGYGVALVLIAALSPSVPPPGSTRYEEAAYHAAETAAAKVLNDSVAALVGLLDGLGIENFRVHGQDEVTLSACFQQKTAATLAGLGWTGRNSMLVCDGFGPRVEIATVLAAHGPAGGEPVTESLCGSCDLCVEACPAGALKGGTWRPGIGRDALIDAFACDRWRRSHIPSLGRKHSCWLCAAACPVGG